MARPSHFSDQTTPRPASEGEASEAARSQPRQGAASLAFGWPALDDAEVAQRLTCRQTTPREQARDSHRPLRIGTVSSLNGAAAVQAALPISRRPRSALSRSAASHPCAGRLIECRLADGKREQVCRPRPAPDAAEPSVAMPQPPQACSSLAPCLPPMLTTPLAKNR